MLIKITLSILSIYLLAWVICAGIIFVCYTVKKVRTVRHIVNNLIVNN